MGAQIPALGWGMAGGVSHRVNLLQNQSCSVRANAQALTGPGILPGKVLQSQKSCYLHTENTQQAFQEH